VAFCWFLLAGRGMLACAVMKAVSISNITSSLVASLVASLVLPSIIIGGSPVLKSQHYTLEGFL